jgi:hypothetical protein
MKMGNFTELYTVHDGWDIEKINQAAQQVEAIKDNEELLRIAQDDNYHTRTRLAAVKGISDTRQLLELGLKEYDGMVAAEAVKAISDEAMLESIAESARSQYAKITAVTKISDPKLLAAIAANNDCVKARGEAVKKLPYAGNETLLNEIAINDYHDDIREAAAEKVEDSSVLLDIALKEKGLAAICYKALIKLAKPEETAYAAKNADWWAARRAAVELLDDDAVLSDIAYNDENEEVRKAAIEKISDPEMKSAAVNKEKAVSEKENAAKLVSDSDIERICAQIRSDALRERINAANEIYEMRSNRLFSKDGRSHIIGALLAEMQRTVSSDFDYSMAVGALNYNGNQYIGKLLARFYHDEETLLCDKEKIRLLNDSLVSYTVYEGRKSPVFFDPESSDGIRLHGQL